MSIAQLCRWFWVPRATFYYRGERRAPHEHARRCGGRGGPASDRPESDLGLRRFTAQVRRELQAAVNRNKVHAP